VEQRRRVERRKVEAREIKNSKQHTPTDVGSFTTWHRTCHSSHSLTHAVLPRHAPATSSTQPVLLFIFSFSLLLHDSFVSHRSLSCTVRVSIVQHLSLRLLLEEESRWARCYTCTLNHITCHHKVVLVVRLPHLFFFSLFCFLCLSKQNKFHLESEFVCSPSFSAKHSRLSIRTMLFKPLRNRMSLSVLPSPHRRGHAASLSHPLLFSSHFKQSFSFLSYSERSMWGYTLQ